MAWYDQVAEAMGCMSSYAVIWRRLKCKNSTQLHDIKIMSEYRKFRHELKHGMNWAGILQNQKGLCCPRYSFRIQLAYRNPQLMLVHNSAYIYMNIHICKHREISRRLWSPIFPLVFSLIIQMKIIFISKFVSRKKRAKTLSFDRESMVSTDGHIVTTPATEAV